MTPPVSQEGPRLFRAQALEHHLSDQEPHEPLRARGPWRGPLMLAFGVGLSLGAAVAAAWPLEVPGGGATRPALRLLWDHLRGARR